MITDLWRGVFSKSSAIVVCVICCGVLAASAETRKVEVGFVIPEAARAVFEWRRLSAEWHFKPDASARADFRGPYGGSLPVNPDGRAVINLLVPGTLRVEVAPAAALDVRGKAEITVTPEQFNSAEQVVLTVPLEPVKRATLVVTLLDARTRRLLVNQKVSLADLRGDRATSYATTDHMGRAKLSAELGGTYRLRLETGILGHMPARAISEAEIRRGQIRWLVVTPVAVLNGHIVVREADSPETSPTDIGPSALLLGDDQGHSYRPRTQGDVAFVVYEGDIPPGTYDLRLDTDRLRRFELVEPQQVTVPTDADAAADITVVVRPRPQYDVTIRLCSTGPRAGSTTIHLVNPYYTCAVEAMAPGDAKFSGIPSGSYTVSIRSPVFQDVVRRPLVVAKQGQVHEFELVQSFVYTASVLRDGVPATDAWPSLLEVKDEKRVCRIAAKKEGKLGPWQCVDLNPGPHMVLVEGKKGLVYVSEIFEVRGDVTQTIQLPSTVALSGTVSGLERLNWDEPRAEERPFPFPRPRPKPRLALLMETPNGLTVGVGAAAVEVTPEENTYEFALPPGRYRAYLLADTNGYHLGDLTLDASDRAARGDFKLSPEVLSRPIPMKVLTALERDLRERRGGKGDMLLFHLLAGKKSTGIPADRHFRPSAFRLLFPVSGFRFPSSLTRPPSCFSPRRARLGCLSIRGKSGENQGKIRENQGRFPIYGKFGENLEVREIRDSHLFRRPRPPPGPAFRHSDFGVDSSFGPRISSFSFAAPAVSLSNARFAADPECPAPECDLRASAGSYAHKGMHMAWMEKVRKRA